MQLAILGDRVHEAVDQAMGLVPRIWAFDHTVWGDDPTEVSDRLGWLRAAERSDVEVPDLVAVAREVIEDGVTDVLLVGMGGSSLYPDVLARTFGSAAGRPRFHVLDSTDPAAVLAMEAELPWQSTLLIPASKSGTTLEMTCHLERFLAKLHKIHGPEAGRFVIPITDPGSELNDRAEREGFRRVINGQPDVGGRFSALTAFGSFPAALLGLDLQGYLQPAREELQACRSTDPHVNLAAVLGAALAVAAAQGRNKLALVLPEEIRSFGTWIEQLVAESTGKHGVGIVPILDAPVGRQPLGDDHIVVTWGQYPGADDLIAAGVPVLALPWAGAHQLTGEVVRWEFATAVAGALMGINPFDQPDVESAKAAAAASLASGADLASAGSPTDWLSGVRPGQYVALLAFVVPGGDDHQAVEAAAARLRGQTGVAVTVGVGPRYLHSTGQLHKGGPEGGIFLLVVGDDPQDAQVPGRDLTFSRLKRSQAAGDLQALVDAGRQAMLITREMLDALAR